MIFSLKPIRLNLVQSAFGLTIDNTEDKAFNENHPTDALLVSRARPPESYSLRLQNRSLGRLIGHL